jgi:hypothetical protein
MSRAASFAAKPSMNLWRMPAPAPWAKINNAVAVLGRSNRPDTTPALSLTKN